MKIHFDPQYNNLLHTTEEVDDLGSRLRYDKPTFSSRLIHEPARIPHPYVLHIKL